MPSSRETIIAKEIASAEELIKKFSDNKEAVSKLKSKIDRLKKEAKGIPMTASQLAASLKTQRKLVKDMSKTDFNNFIRVLSKKPEYAFLKTYGFTRTKNDLDRKAKPVGWRFKGRGDYRVPTKAQVRAGVKNGTVYYEARPNRSDVSRTLQLGEGGGVDNREKGSAHLYITHTNGVWKVYHGDGFRIPDKATVLASSENSKDGDWSKLWDAIKSVRGMETRRYEEGGSVPMTMSDIRKMHEADFSQTYENDTNDLELTENDVVRYYFEDEPQYAEKGAKMMYGGSAIKDFNVKDLPVGAILNFKDDETWKITKVIGNKSNPLGYMAAPYGKTREHYISVEIEFPIEKLEDDLESVTIS